MNIGYACLTVGVPGVKLRTCTLKNAAPNVLLNLIQLNLEALDKILDYNIKNGIKLFRISSDIIPFGSHPVNTVKWWEVFKDELNEIGHKAIKNGIRLSMHPGQYTVLNSSDESVVKRAVEDLTYHARLLDTMGLGKQHKIVLHIGGIYGDKAEAVKRFISRYRSLNDNIRQLLVIENDDRQYTISDVLSIGNSAGIPVVFDNLHHEVNPDNTYSIKEWICACASTWEVVDGLQKIHYSQQEESKRPGSHSSTLDVGEFLQFYTDNINRNVDIMVEVKDKNLSAIKCINTISPPKIKRLENEWSRYKYLVLEHSLGLYNEIRQLLKDKRAYPVIEFYRLIDDAMMTPIKGGNAINAAQHVWGYFKDSADENTRIRFENRLNKIIRGESAISAKRFLWKLVEAQQQKYLLESLYFMELM